jgi:hypothetical protein
MLHARGGLIQALGGFRLFRALKKNWHKFTIAGVLQLRSEIIKGV